MKQKKEKTFQIMKRREFDYLVEKVKALDNKEKYKYHNRDDLDYFGIKDIENLFGNADDNDCYKPILVKNSFNGN